MSIMQIVTTFAYLQFAKSEAMLRNDIESTTMTYFLSSDHLQLQQKRDIVEKVDLPKGFQKIDHHVLANFTMNNTEMGNTPDSIARKNFLRENFTTNEIQKESDINPLHKKALRFDFENHPERVNEKSTPSITRKSLPSEDDNTDNALMLIILSVFIVTLILVLSFTIYTRNSQISIQLNDNDSKDEKKLRYREVATEEQPTDRVSSENSWKNTLVSKITTVGRRLKSLGGSSTLRNEAEVQMSKTPSTHTLSSRSHHSIEIDEITENTVGEEKVQKKGTMLRIKSWRKNSYFTSSKAQDENLDTSNSICSKCNHYRDPHVIVKRINEIQHREGRIHIPIHIPVVLGSNKIKSVGFHKLSSSQPSTISVQKKCHRGYCCIGTKFSRASSSSGSFQKKKEEKDVASSTCKSKATDDDCTSTSISSSLQPNENNKCNDELSLSTGKSKSKDGCPSTSGSDYFQREKNNESRVESCSSAGNSSPRKDCHSTNLNYSQEEEHKKYSADSHSSAGKSKSNGDVSSSSSRVYFHQNEDEQCYAICDSSSGKSKENYDCFPSKSSTSNQDVCRENCSTKSFAASKCKSKCKSSSCNYPNSSNALTRSSCTNTDYESSSRTQSSESQAEDYFGTITDKTGSSLYDASDKMSRGSSSTSDVPKVEICEEHYNNQECQSAPGREYCTNSSAGCSEKLSSSIVPSTISSHQSAVVANTCEAQSQSHCVHSPQNDEPNRKTSKTKFTEDNCEYENQPDHKCTHTSQSCIKSSSGCSNVAYKAPVKFKVLSTDPNFDPSTLQVKQQLKMLLSEGHNSKKSNPASNKDKLRPGQVIYADLCFVQQQSGAGCANVNACLMPSENKDLRASSQYVCSAVSQKYSIVTSESESDHGYGASQTESAESEEPNACENDHNCDSTDKCNNETGGHYGNCGSKICYDDSSRNLSRKISLGWERRASVDTTMKSSSSAASRGMLIRSLNQRLKGTYLNQTKESSRSRFASSSRCAPVLEYRVDDDDCDVYEPVEEQLETETRSMRNSMNKLLPKIRSYMSKRKKNSTSGSEQVYEEPSTDEGASELCENCLKHVPKDISKTIRSRQSLYSNVDKFKSGGTIHLNDLIEMYPNLYPKLPLPIREALTKCFDEVSTSPYGNLCDNYERVQERKWSELSSSFENINYID